MEAKRQIFPFPELKQTLVLAAPITAGHLSQMLMGFADTLMIGRVGVVPLAASAFANVLIHFLFIIGVGLLSSVSVLVAHAFGAGNRREAGEVLRRGLVLGLLAGGLMTALLIAGLPFLGLLGQPGEVVEASRGYLLLVGLSLSPMMAVICLRNFSEAQDIPWPAFWTGLFSVLLNIFLNWVLIYGHLGSPALGLEGAGLATLLSRLVNLLLLVGWLRLDKRFAGCWPTRWLAAVPWAPLKTMTALGLPVALQLAMEIGAFGAATLLMGWLGVIEIASHQIAITCAATTFMVPLGLSIAVAIRVGQAIGAGQAARVRPIAYSALGFGFLFSCLFAAGFIVFNTPLATVFTADAATIRMAGGLIVVAGFFQVFDGAQVMAAGALRGCKDVRLPTWIIFGAYWVAAIPLGAWQAFRGEWGATGIWIGLASGLGVAAIGLLARFHHLTRCFSAG